MVETSRKEGKMEAFFEGDKGPERAVDGMEKEYQVQHSNLKELT